VAAVERQDRQQVDQAEREADQGQEQECFRRAFVNDLVVPGSAKQINSWTA
jgi:hypothetical protein